MRMAGLILGVLLCLSGGCSGQRSLSRGGATALMVVGGIAAVTGALVAAGCSEVTDDRGCGDAPSDPDPQVGLPMMSAGMALITAGALAGPFRTRSPAVLPAPVSPDPFVPPLANP